MKLKNTLTIIVVLLIVNNLKSQQKLDSTVKDIQLKEVLICHDDKNQQNEAFNFYRSSKINSTEDILSRIEGVNLIKRGAFGLEPTLRTYNAGQINIMVNGMKMYGACTDKMDPVSAYIEPSNLDKLQVNQGASAAANGSTIGGNLNFQLKEAVFNTKNLPSVTAFLQYSSVNKGFNNGVSLNLNKNKIAFRLAAVYKNVGNYTDGGGLEVKYTQYEKVNLQLNTVIKLGNNNKLIADIIYDKGVNIGYAALPMDVSSATGKIAALTHQVYFKKFLNALMETKLYYNEVVHYMDDTRRPETPMHMDMPGWSNTVGFYSKINLEKKKHIFETRLDAHKAYTRADMTMYPKNEKEMYMQTLPGNNLFNSGLSITYNYKINKTYGFGSMVRSDFYEQKAIDNIGILQWEGFGFDVSKQTQNWLHNGSFWVKRNAKNLNSKLVLAFGARIPTSNERMGFYLFNRADGYDYIGNLNLKPEQALQVDFINNFTIKKIVFTTTFFYHHIYNYIYAYLLPPAYSAMTIGARGVKTYQNIEYAKLMGFESTIGFKLHNKISFKANLRYTYGLLNTGLYMQQVPPFKIINTIRFQNKLYQIQIEHFFAHSQNLINQNFGEVNTAGWHSFNARFAFTKSIKKSIFQLNTAIENLFDLNYREHLDWGNIPQPGLNFIIGINYYFN
ncbi:MAG: TonB-dependent receptor plug domain-containing protein [Candidatus Methylacidiphilales bacterium]